jgi:ATP-dependent RNA helicase DDX5/DBP2
VTRVVFQQNIYRNVLLLRVTDRVLQIIDQMRPDRQTVMFSATWPMNVRALAREYMTDPVRINIGSLQLSANKRVRQQFEFLAEHQKSAK